MPSLRAGPRTATGCNQKRGQSPLCIFMRTKAATHLCAFVLVAAHWSLLAADDPEERGLPQDVGIGEWRARVLEAAARRVSELEATIRARDSEIAVLRAGGARAHVSSPVQALPEAGVSKKQPAGRPPSLSLSLSLSLAPSLPPFSVAWCQCIFLYCDNVDMCTAQQPPLTRHHRLDSMCTPLQLLPHHRDATVTA